MKVGVKIVILDKVDDLKEGEEEDEESKEEVKEIGEPNTDRDGVPHGGRY